MKRLFVLLSPFTLHLSPSSLHACAVCFGAAGGNLARGFYWGILLLLLLPLVLFSSIAFMIVRSTRKKNLSTSLPSL